MKRFLQGVMEWKVWTALMFAGVVIIYLIVKLFLGDKTIEVSTMLSLLIFTAVGSFIQFLAFSDYIIKHMRYSLRMIVFVIPYAVLITVCAILFRWFPTEVAGAWIMFIIIFLLVFAGITIGFEIYFRLSGKRYDGLLGQYKKQKESKENHKL